MSSRRILPLFDRVLVQRIKAAQRTKSGLFIPENAQETLNEAIVVEVGPGNVISGKLVPVSVVKGDHVLLPPFGGSAVKMGDEEMILFRDTEILAKILK